MTAKPTENSCEAIYKVTKRQAALIKGEPIKARLVVSRILDANQHCLAGWYLLSNVSSIPADTLALWYYWRWQIECFFKLLKQQGLQLEDWQQASGLAIAKLSSLPVKPVSLSGNFNNKTRLTLKNLNTS